LYFENRSAAIGVQNPDPDTYLLPYIMNLRLLSTALAFLLAGCEIPGLEPDPRIAQRAANAKAIGGACRFGLRSIEDCYILNAEAAKADVFTGWKEMDQYMRENNVEGIRATVVKPPEPIEEIIEDSKEDSKSKAAAKTSAKPGAH
jgi:hypothetical protein